MKNILMTILAVLITILVILAMVRGISFGNVEILSIAQIINKNNELDEAIENVNNLKNVTYKKNIDDLQTSIKSLSTSKQKYLDLASISTDSEIQSANIEQSYAREYLWNKVGSYATQQGVNLKMSVESSGSNNLYTLNFTVVGSYISIINYVYALENDADLAFRIENFKITTGSGDDKLNCTFTVSNISIKEEITTQSVGSSDEQGTINQNTSDQSTTNQDATVNDENSAQ